MKRLLAIAVAIAAITMFTETQANAQGFGSGFQFGSGVNAVNYGGFQRGFQREQPPYFAKFPPVYYSHIVKRPYGVSPYAAPAGVMPVEMNYAPKSVTISNPFYGKGTLPAKAPANAKQKTPKNKVTVISTPYMTNVAKR